MTRGALKGCTKAVLFASDILRAVAYASSKVSPVSSTVTYLPPSACTRSTFCRGVFCGMKIVPRTSRAAQFVRAYDLQVFALEEHPGTVLLREPAIPYERRLFHDDAQGLTRFVDHLHIECLRHISFL